MKPPQPRDRIRLIAMPEDPDPVAPGTTGTIVSVHPHSAGGDTWYQVIVAWDTGRTLMLVIPPDEFEVLPPEDRKGG